MRPTYQAIVDQALRTTGASTGWLLAVTGSTMRVVAAAGLAAEYDLIGSELTPTGAQGYVLSSAQPAALMPQPNDPANNGAAGFPGVPTSILAVPCGDDAPIGVLELAGKADAGPFTFDDIESLATLASVAGAALTEGDDTSTSIATPAELATGLERLATIDPSRYAQAAGLIESLLGHPA
ncbi:MAG: GAF domain-containing protein [Actinomycetia bacterium]|nr:GAF domain-containing protein [Actinomycetes bacterium]